MAATLRAISLHEILMQCDIEGHVRPILMPNAGPGPRKDIQQMEHRWIELQVIKSDGV